MFLQARQGSAKRLITLLCAAMTHSLPPAIEEYRDEHWRREGTTRVETALEAERFIEQVGFSNCLTDSRKPGPSLYIAVCGRRDAVMPRNVQKDPEASATWVLKDELVRRGKDYYGKLTKARTLFLAPRMIPFFNAIWGVPKSQEKKRLSNNALAVLKVLRKEWEMATSDLRLETGIADRRALTHAFTRQRWTRRWQRGPCARGRRARVCRSSTTRGTSAG